MNIVFSNLALWPLALLVAVAVAFGLLARSKPPAYSFSSVEFIVRILRTTESILFTSAACNGSGEQPRR